MTRIYTSMHSGSLMKTTLTSASAADVLSLTFVTTISSHLLNVELLLETRLLLDACFVFLE
jgi:hypothetical protein